MEEQQFIQILNINGYSGTIQIAAAPIREGYDFEGWYTSSGIKYNPLDYYSGSANLTLNAKWKVKTYTITYNANGGNALEGDLINPAKCVKTYGFDYIIPTTIPTRNAYTFKGWSEDQSATTGEYQPGDRVTRNESITLYAVWEGSTYTVEYDANGGVNGPTSSGAILKDTDVNISTTKPTKTGYNFIGWSTNQNGNSQDVEYQPGDTYTGRTSIKLYAIWESKVYTIIYMNGSTEFERANKTYGINTYITANVPTKSGYNFYGWSTVSNPSTVEYYTNQIFKDDNLFSSDTLKLYAVWRSEDELTYSINYIANGGKIGEQDKIIYTLGFNETEVQITTDTPTREGYTFKGWSTNQNATEGDSRFQAGNNCTISRIESLGTKKEGYDYDNNTTVVIGYELNLYAIWEGNPVTLTIDPNGGTYDGQNNIQVINCKAGDKIVLSLPEKEKYVGIWTINEGDASQEVDEDQQNITMGIQNSTIIADYYSRYYSITYKPNTDDTTVADMPKDSEALYNTDTTISEDTPTRTGYTFSGWTIDGETIYQPGDSITMPGNNVELKAVWTANTYTVTFNENGGGTPNPTSKTVTYDSTYGTLATVSRTGYIFQGWYTATTGGTQISASTKVKITSNQTLYAHWKAETYTIKYDANGGEGAPSEQTKTYGVALTLSSKAPTKEDYTFQGWATSSNATSAVYQPGGSYTAEGNATLYAVWEQDVTDISLNTTDAQWIPQTGGTVTLTATTSPSSVGVTWTSSNNSVATVSGGSVTAVGAGVTTITASAKGYSDSVTVYVYNAVFGEGYDWATKHHMYATTEGNSTGIFATYGDEVGTKMILSNVTGSWYRLEDYTNGYYESGYGEYFSPEKRYFTSYGAW